MDSLIKPKLYTLVENPLVTYWYIYTLTHSTFVLKFHFLFLFHPKSNNWKEVYVQCDIVHICALKKCFQLVLYIFTKD